MKIVRIGSLAAGLTAAVVGLVLIAPAAAAPQRVQMRLYEAWWCEDVDETAHNLADAWIRIEPGRGSDSYVAKQLFMLRCESKVMMAASARAGCAQRGHRMTGVARLNGVCREHSPRFFSLVEQGLTTDPASGPLDVAACEAGGAEQMFFYTD